MLNEIQLNPALRHEQHRVLLRYLTDELSLSVNDWRTLVEAVDHLGASIVVVDGHPQTFWQFYSQRIDQPFADAFLSQLMALQNVEEGRRVQASVAREMGRQFDGTEGFTRHDNKCRMLLIYCLYWWEAFARGYIFEVSVFQDLKASGIRFIPHNITDRSERFAPSDLLVENLRGDIKYTTYFLTTERLAQLVSDFFITRWYLVHSRQHLWVTLLRQTAWQRLKLEPPVEEDASPGDVTFDGVAEKLPEAVV